MSYVALGEAYSIPELAHRHPPHWLGSRFSRCYLADWARKLPDWCSRCVTDPDLALSAQSRRSGAGNGPVGMVVMPRPSGMFCAGPAVPARVTGGVGWRNGYSM